MTAITVSPLRATRRQPVPWTRLAYVTWRQHRAALTGAAAFLGLISLYLLIMGLAINNAYAKVASCRPASSGVCQQLAHDFNGQYWGGGGTGALSAGGAQTVSSLMLVVPVLLGVFLGAPVLAREFETGTFRFAWTQGCGRAALGGHQARAARGRGNRGHLGVHRAFQLVLPRLPGRRPGEQAAAAGVRPARRRLRRLDAGRLRDRRVLRRAHPAHPPGDGRDAGHLDHPGHRDRGMAAPALPGRRCETTGNPPNCAWILGNYATGPNGQVLSQRALNQLFQQAPASVQNSPNPNALRTGWPSSTTRSGRRTSRRSRFWHFQLIEGGWLLALSVVLIAAAIWLVRRRAA